LPSWAIVPAGSAEDWVVLRDSAGLLLCVIPVDSTDFDFDEVSDRYFRLGYAWPPPDELRDGLAGLTAAAKTATRSGTWD
jgi:DNA-binding transcriptional MocR family regulator